MKDFDLKDIETKTDEELLVLSLLQPDAYEHLVSRYEEAFTYKVLSIVKNKEEAEDIVQDTFVKIYVHGRKFKPQEGATFKSWAYRVLLNTCFSRLKKLKREKEFVAAVEPEILQSFGEDSKEESKLNFDHFLFIVSKLTKSASKLLKKVMLEGKSHEQIASEEGISIEAARTRLHRARSEFKKVDRDYRLKTINKIKNA